MARSVLLSLCVLALGCDTSDLGHHDDPIDATCDDGSTAALVIRVEDTKHHAVTPDRVLYNVDATGPIDGMVDDATEHAAECANDDCSGWRAGCGEIGDFYLWAEIDDAAQGCTRIADDEASIHDGEQGLELTLTFDGSCPGIPG